MNTTTVSDQRMVDQKTVAIVAFKQNAGRVLHYQVTIDPAAVSPSGRFIRFGQHPGDEIVGWQPLHEISVVEILATWAPDPHSGVPMPPKIELGSDGILLDFERTTVDFEEMAYPPQMIDRRYPGA